MTRRAALGATLTLVALASGCVVVDVQAPEVCIAHQDVQFVGVQSSRTAEIGLRLAERLDLEITFLRGSMIVTEGMATASAVDFLQIDVSSETQEASLPPVSIVSQPIIVSGDGAIAIESDNLVNLIEYFSAGAMVFDFSARGVEPDASWRADTELCFSGVGSYEANLLGGSEN
jgi:hypothetical protein